ncbi:hypothetical protein Acid345_1037 [Candidatus Koribacter versatilis Ellin345]|uniref:DUF4097 domain-containing protein n=1 Tax=Koribacter versatilis (strain Ellin345) TaxID=204669 RepID=Q1ISW0_KORVE|nr:DUF4097 family beta strand repeat-containing protein [Candidatus Koribacter versatilis]ABF40040.1 hypothetical protein Acid345_1037 [Candidatus Koribacter versatilis Ellin345]
MFQWRRKTALAAASLLVVLASALSAAAAQFRDEFHKTYPASPNINVSLSNINGSVEITAWDRNEVQLDAVKTANTQEKLNEAEIRVDASNDRIHIETHYPEHRTNNNPANVEYQLHVPRSARLDKIDLVNGKLDIDGVKGEVHGASVNGAISARGLTGDVELSTVNGSVSSELVDLNSARRVKLSSVNGHVELAMPKDANAHLSASTVSGSISSDFQLPIHKGWVGSDLDTTLGSGTTRVELSNVNGSIKIHGGNAGI